MNTGIQIISVIVVLAGFIESTVELLLGTWLKGPFLLIVTLGAGVLAAVTLHIGILTFIGFDVNPVADMVLSGLVMGRGAQFVHDFVPSLSFKNTPPE